MAQFPLIINGTEVCTVEELKKNFNPTELIPYRNRFAAWLKGWDYDEEAVEVKALRPDLTDEEWLSAVCKIIGISGQELAASRKRREETVRTEQEKTAKKQAVKNKREKTLKLSAFTIEDAPWKDENSDDFVGVSVCGNKIFISFNTKRIGAKGRDRNSLYVSEDGRGYKHIVVDDSNHSIGPVSMINNHFVCIGLFLYFSTDGYQWDFCHPIITRSLGRKQLVFTGKQYVLLSGFDEIAISESDRLDGDWDGYPLEVDNALGLYFHDDKFYLETSDSLADSCCTPVVYCSEDAIDWEELDPSEDIKFMDLDKKKPWRACGQKVFFSLENNTKITASNGINGSHEKVADCPFETREILVYKNKLLLIGKNLEYATATYKFE